MMRSRRAVVWLALLGPLLLRAAEGTQPAGPDFRFTPGEELDYRIHLKRQWRDPALRNLPNWVGELKVWPIWRNADGTTLLRARLGLNPDLSGDTFAHDESVAWAQMTANPAGELSPWYLHPTSDETPPIALTFPPPPSPAGRERNKEWPGGLTNRLRFAESSSPQSPIWHIEEDLHSESDAVRQHRVRILFTYDPSQRRVLASKRSEVNGNNSVALEEVTAEFIGAHHLPPTEAARIDQDSALLVHTWSEMDDFVRRDPSEKDFAAYEVESQKIIGDIRSAKAELKTPDWSRELPHPEPNMMSKIVTQKEADVRAGDTRIGQQSPDWTVMDVNGRPRSLHDFRGRLVLLDFWAHTCGPCLLSMPAINRLEQDNADQHFTVLGMNTGDSPAVINQVAARGRLRALQLQAAPVTRLYGVHAIPVYILIDGRGVVRWRQRGWDEAAEATLRAEVHQLLAETKAAKSID